MGSDGFQNINKWHNAGVILQNYPIYIYKRPGFEITETFNADIKILEAPLFEISTSHYIRKLIREKKSIKYLVPEDVKEEIEKNNYYRSSLEKPADQ